MLHNTFSGDSHMSVCPYNIPAQLICTYMYIIVHYGNGYHDNKKPICSLTNDNEVADDPYGVQ